MKQSKNINILEEVLKCCLFLGDISKNARNRRKKYNYQQQSSNSGRNSFISWQADLVDERFLHYEPQSVSTSQILQNSETQDSHSDAKRKEKKQGFLHLLFGGRLHKKEDPKRKKSTSDSNRFGPINQEIVQMAQRLRTNQYTLDFLEMKNVGDGECQIIAEALKTNTTVSSLRLSLNGITPIGCGFLGEILDTQIGTPNTTLTELSLNSNHKIGAIGVKNLLEKAAENIYLTKLNLNETDVGDEGSLYLAEFLAKNWAINELLIAKCGIGSNGIKKIAESLKMNVSLKILDVSGNEKIGNEGAIALAEKLLENSSLEFLDLSNCGIEDEGAMSLCEALKTSPNFNKLILVSNKTTTLTNIYLANNCKFLAI